MLPKTSEVSQSKKSEKTRNTCSDLAKTNPTKLPKSNFLAERGVGGNLSYLEESNLREIIAEAYQPALERASLKAFEGRYDDP